MDRFVGKFTIDVLAVATIEYHGSLRRALIQTRGKVWGLIEQERQEIGYYSRLDEEYHYDPKELEPLANNEFEYVKLNGERYEAPQCEKIVRIDEVFDDECIYAEIEGDYNERE